jgi:hypothetical protein
LFGVLVPTTTRRKLPSRHLTRHPTYLLYTTRPRVIFHAMSFFSAGRVRSATISRLTSDRTSRSSTTLRSRSSSQISASGSQNPLIDVALADDEPAASPAALQQSGISNACVNVIAEVMGAGMLSLPHCVATLGWIVGLSAVAAFGAL